MSLAGRFGLFGAAVRTWAMSRTVYPRVRAARLLFASDRPEEPGFIDDVGSTVRRLCEGRTVPHFDNGLLLLAAVAPYAFAGESGHAFARRWRLRVCYEQDGRPHEIRYPAEDIGRRCRLPYRTAVPASEPRLPNSLVAAYAIIGAPVDAPSPPTRRVGVGPFVQVLAGPRRDFGDAMGASPVLASDVMDSAGVPDAVKLVLVSADGRCFGFLRDQSLRWPPSRRVPSGRLPDGHALPDGAGLLSAKTKIALGARTDGRDDGPAYG